MSAGKRKASDHPNRATSARPGTTEKTGGRVPRSPLEIRRRAALADAVLETSSLGVVMVDEAGRIVRTNARLAQMFGYRPDEFDGLSLEILLP